jgi:polysaccharide export outer membrane protein
VILRFAIDFLNKTGSAARHRMWIRLVLAAAICSLSAINPRAQSLGDTSRNITATGTPFNLESTEDYNRRLRERFAFRDSMSGRDPGDYVIGPEDVLDISVFEAPEMNRDVRVSASGEISLPLLGAIAAAGDTPRELETALEHLLRERYMKDPHVSVFVHDMQSHPVSVMGAVRKPGIFQIRGNKSLLEVLSLAEGLADDAGEEVIILRDAGLQNAPGVLTAQASNLTEPLPTIDTQEFGAPKGMDSDPTKLNAISPDVVKIDLKDLLDSTDPTHNPAVYPGDIVKVSRAGIVYVVGAVQRPGGFAMKTNEKISVLQAIALSEGLTRTAAKGSARIISTNPQNGARSETPINLGKILSGKSPDPMLRARDIVFIPDSVAKATLTRGAEATVQTVTGLAIFRW